MNPRFGALILVLVSSQAYAGISDYLGSIRSTFVSDCVYSEWTPWSECSAPCNFPGFRSRSRDIVSHSGYGGYECDKSLLEQWEDCQETCAPTLVVIQDCQMTLWSSWGACQPDNGICGPGKRDRSRAITVLNERGGAPCGDVEEWQRCNAGECARDCRMADWSQWSRCSADCGEGTRTRTRSILENASFNGRQCGLTEEIERCTYGECARDCVMEQWSEWTRCSADCGQGSRSRTRGIKIGPSSGGQKCGDVEEWEACTYGDCVRDCQMSSWSLWTRCSADCGIGKRSRTRFIQSEPSANGIPCGSLEEWEDCNSGECARDCQLSFWSPWTRCSADCGFGRRSRTRFVTEQPSLNGRQCGNLEEWEDCNNGECAQDCLLSAWSSWTRCSADCGVGKRSRTRFIQKEPTLNGRQCGSLEEWEDCNSGECARDCRMSLWTSWTRCSADCGIGKRSRTRFIEQEARGNGIGCGNLEEWEDCNSGPCTRDCQLSFWTAWTRCSADCGIGKRSRTRSITQQPTFNGRQCGNLEEWEDCNSGSCAQDCIMTLWTRWTRCSADCGQGTRSRTRQIQVGPKGNGRPCGDIEEWENCSSGPCAQDCQMTSWTFWSQCSATCGQGLRTRTRSITTRASNGGRPCGDLKESESCNNGECRDCFKECLAQCRRGGSGFF